MKKGTMIKKIFSVVTVMAIILSSISARVIFQVSAEDNWVEGGLNTAYIYNNASGTAYQNPQLYWDGLDWINISNGKDGGLNIAFKNAFTNVREGLMMPSCPLDGFKVVLDNFQCQTNAHCDNFTLLFGNTTPDKVSYRPGDYNAFILVFNVAEGKVIFNSSGTVLLSDEKLLKSNIVGKEISVYFKKTINGDYGLYITVGGQNLPTATISYNILQNYNSILQNCTMCITAWGEQYNSSTHQTFSIDLMGVGIVKTEYVTVDMVVEAIDNIGTVTLNNAFKIRDAREKYEFLSNNDKQEVTNYFVLEKAESEYKKLEVVANENLVLMNKQVAMIHGSGLGNQVEQVWGGYVQFKEIPTGGLRYEFTSSIRDVREGYINPISLDGAYLQFDNLDAQSEENCSFTVYIGNTPPEWGPQSIIPPLALTLLPSQGRIVANPSGTVIIESDELKIENIRRRRFSYAFSKSASGVWELTVDVNGKSIKGSIPSEVIYAAYDLHSPTRCYVMLSNWNTSTYSIDFVGLKYNEEYMPGDTNVDCKVDILDLIRFKKHLSLNNIILNKAAADLDKNGKVDSLDIVELRKKLLFTPYEPAFYGRFLRNKDGTVSFDWSGSTIVGGFYGSEIAVNLSAAHFIAPYQSFESYDILTYSIDGGEKKKLTVHRGAERTYKLAENLSQGYHYVEIIKITEMNFGLVINFHGFDYLSGKSAPAPQRNEDEILFIGDSITAGYGSASAAGSKGFKLNEQDVTKTYGWFTAQELGMVYTATSMSGYGMYQSNSGNKEGVLSNYYDLTLGHNKNFKYDFAKKPKIIVVNLGTNDFGQTVDTNRFKEKYKAFINELRTVCPDAYIVCAIGPMTTAPNQYIEAVVDDFKKQSDSKIEFCSMNYSSNNSAFIGADNHPTEAGHRDIYKTLLTVITDLMKK